MKLNRSAWVGLAGLGWLVGIVLLYYAGHKPVIPDVALALGLALWRLVSALLLVALAGGLGHWILSRGFDLPPLLSQVLQASLGLGIFSLVILIVGSTLGLPSWLLWLALLALVILLRKHVLGWLRLAEGLTGLWRSGGRLGKALGIILALIFLSSLFIALAPPIYFDALVDHLVMANAYVSQGRVSYLPWITMSGMPQNTEMLFTWAIALGGNQSATVLGWMIGLLAVVGLMGYLEPVYGARSAWVGAAALMAGYTTAVLLSSGYVDWLALLFGLAALACLDEWRQQGLRRTLILAGIFSGLAAGSKYTAAVLVAAGLGTLAWHAWKRRAAIVPVLLQFGAAALLAMLPWLVKNGLATGNPVYPFFFPSNVVSQVHFEVFQRINPWGNALDFFFLPVRATLFGFDLGDGYMFSAGPLLLGLAGLAWIGMKGMNDRQRSSLQNAFMIAAVGLIVWAVGNQYSGRLIQARYYMVIFPAFAALAATGEWGFRQVSLARVRLGRIAAVLILMAITFNLIETGLKTINSGAVQAALGLKSQDSYLADNLGWFQPAMQAVSELPQGSRVLLLYEPRALYCQPRCTGDEIMDRWKQARALYLDDSTQIRRAWEAEGYTHLLLYRQGLEFLVDASDPNHTPDDLSTLNVFLSGLPQPVKLGGVYELYSLN